MVPTTREELSRMVTDVTLDTYEELSPQLIAMLEEVKHNHELSESQKNDEVLLNMMGYIKSCTNEILIEVLARILGVEQ